MLRATFLPTMLLIWFAHTSVLAEGVADKLPDTTVGYVRIRDAQELHIALQKTGIGRMFRDRELSEFLESLTQAALDYQFPASSLARNDQDATGANWRHAYLGRYGEVVLAFVANKKREVQRVFIIEHADDEKQLQSLVESYLASAQRRGGRRHEEKVAGGTLTYIQSDNRGISSATVYQRDGRVFQCDSATTLLNVVTAWDGRSRDTLSRSAAWNQYQRQTTLDPASAEVEFFADLSSLVQVEDEEKLSMPETSRSCMTLAGRLVVGESPHDLRLDAELVRDPLAMRQRLAFRAGDTAIESWVPKGAASYATVSFDRPASRDEHEELAESLAERAREWGVPLPAGLETLAPYMTGRLAHCRWYVSANRDSVACDVIAAHILRNEESERALEQVVHELGDAARRLDVGGVQLHEISLTGGWSENEPRVYLMCLDNSLLLVSCRKGVQSVLDAWHTVDARLAEEFEYRLVASKLKRLAGEQQASAALFARPSEFVRQIHAKLEDELARFALRERHLRDPFHRSLFRALEEHPLPSLTIFNRYLAPCGGVAVERGNVLRFTIFVQERRLSAKVESDE